MELLKSLIICTLPVVAVGTVAAPFAVDRKALRAWEVNKHTAPSSAMKRLQVELEPGETLWCFAYPKPSIMIVGPRVFVAHAAVWTCMGLGLVCGGLYPFFVNSDKSAHVSWEFTAMGLVLIWMSLGLFRSIFGLYQRSLSTVYALTNTRALLLNSDAIVTLIRYDDVRFGPIDEVRHSAGHGDVLFGTRLHEGKSESIGFYGIENYRDVSETLKHVWNARPARKMPSSLKNSLADRLAG